MHHVKEDRIVFPVCCFMPFSIKLIIGGKYIQYTFSYQIFQGESESKRLSVFAGYQTVSMIHYPFFPFHTEETGSPFTYEQVPC